MRGPKSDPTKPHSRSNGNRKSASTAFQQAQVQKVVAEKPVKPKGLTKEAGGIWDAVVSELFELGLVCKLDGTQLAEYCEQVAMIQDLRKLLKERIKAKEQLKDLLDQIDKASKIALRLAESFGLTPKGRRAMGINTVAKNGGAAGVTGKAPVVGDPSFVFHGIKST